MARPWDSTLYIEPTVSPFIHPPKCPECSSPGSPTVHRVVDPSVAVVAPEVVVVVVVFGLQPALRPALLLRLYWSRRFWLQLLQSDFFQLFYSSFVWLASSSLGYIQWLLWRLLSITDVNCRQHLQCYLLSSLPFVSLELELSANLVII